MAVTTIEEHAKLATMINVFTVEPAYQRELVDLLGKATEEVIRHQPGFVAANIHAALDGTKVVNYAQWESAEALDAMLANPDCRQHLHAASAIADVAPALYSVESVHHI